MVVDISRLHLIGKLYTYIIYGFVFVMNVPIFVEDLLASAMNIPIFVGNLLLQRITTTFFVRDLLPLILSDIRS